MGQAGEYQRPGWLLAFAGRPGERGRVVVLIVTLIDKAPLTAFVVGLLIVSWYVLTRPVLRKKKGKSLPEYLDALTESPIDRPVNILFSEQWSY